MKNTIKKILIFMDGHYKIIKINKNLIKYYIIAFKIVWLYKELSKNIMN